MDKKNRIVGKHYIIDVWGAINLDNADYLSETFRLMAAAGNARVLDIFLHEFPTYGGLTGVAVLAESHISVHTWPELDYAAFDIFMCGNCFPDRAVDVLQERIKPKEIVIKKLQRGNEVEE